MTGLFLFCLIAGGALTAVFAFAGDGDGMLDVLPLSSVTTALGVFGAAGLGLQSTSAPGMAAFGIATGIGVVTGGASIAAFRYLRRSSTTTSRTDKEMEGSIAQVVVIDQNGANGEHSGIGGVMSQLPAAVIGVTEQIEAATGVDILKSLQRHGSGPPPPAAETYDDDPVAAAEDGQGAETAEDRQEPADTSDRGSSLPPPPGM